MIPAIADEFRDYRKVTGDSLSAAILVLAHEIATFKLEAGSSVGHEVCMGIRHGLFGAGANSQNSLAAAIPDGGAFEIGEAAESLESLASAAHRIADAMGPQKD